MKRLILVLCLLSLPACVKAPPDLTPKIAAQFYATQTIHYLDAVRDFADNASKTTPPAISKATLLIVVDWHETIAKTLHAYPDGWKATAVAGLDQLIGKLPPADVAKFHAVIDAARVYIQES